MDTIERVVALATARARRRLGIGGQPLGVPRQQCWRAWIAANGAAVAPYILDEVLRVCMDPDRDDLPFSAYARSLELLRSLLRAPA